MLVFLGRGGLLPKPAAWLLANLPHATTPPRRLGGLGMLWTARQSPEGRDTISTAPLETRRRVHQAAWDCRWRGRLPVIEKVRTIAMVSILVAVSACGRGPQIQPLSTGFVEGRFSASDAAVRACRAKLAAETSGRLKVVGSRSSGARSSVYMRIGPSGAPWQCSVGSDGSNPTVGFMGYGGMA